MREAAGTLKTDQGRSHPRRNARHPCGAVTPGLPHTQRPTHRSTPHTLLVAPSHSDHANHQCYWFGPRAPAHVACVGLSAHATPLPRGRAPPDCGRASGGPALPHQRAAVEVNTCRHQPQCCCPAPQVGARSPGMRNRWSAKRQSRAAMCARVHAGAPPLPAPALSGLAATTSSPASLHSQPGHSCASDVRAVSRPRAPQLGG